MRAPLLATVTVLALALMVAAPGLGSAQQSQKGGPMGPGMMGGSGMGPGMGMMHGMGPGMGMGMGPCMEMMMGGMGPAGEKLSDDDRGDLLVLEGQLLQKKAELLKKQAEAMIAEGERLSKKEEKK